jgi:hypothetical protein
MKARVIETIRPIRNLTLMILKPSLSAVKMTLMSIQVQITPNATD